MHVVVAVNESEPSLFAFDWMIENILKESKSHKLSILTIVEPPVQAGYYYAASGAIYSANFLEEIYKKATEDATACVKKFQKRLEEKLGADAVLPACELVVGRGDTRDEIVDYIEASKADLLIMGSRDMNALKRTFIGSTGDYCIHHCHCPVLIVKHHPESIKNVYIQGNKITTTIDGQLSLTTNNMSNPILEEEEDILSDIRNLFVSSSDDSEEQEEEEKMIQHNLQQQQEAEVEEAEELLQTTTKVEPLHSPPPPREEYLKKSLEQEKPKNPSSPPPKPGQVIAKLPTKNDDKKTTTTTPPPSTTTKKVCKSNKDCEGSLYCQVKSGKCIAKIELGKNGCTASDQCAGTSLACYNKKCFQGCKESSSSCPTGQECKVISDLKIFKGLDGSFNGVCEIGGTSSSKQQPSPSTSTSKTSMALVGGGVTLLLIGLIIGFIYLRGFLRRQHRDNNPDMFLFNKLQRNASQTLLQQQPAGDVLNSRLSNVGGARFTKWAAL